MVTCQRLIYKKAALSHDKTTSDKSKNINIYKLKITLFFFI